MSLRFSLLSAVLILCLAAQAQKTIGNPSVINFSKTEYDAGTQNWCIAQDARGVMYFANNQGLLTYDGAYWRKFLLPNRSIVRSIWISPEQRVYVGAQSEFGYFEPAGNGNLVYHSLSDSLTQSSTDFTDVWNISEFKGHVFFRAYRKIFEYDGKKLKVHDGVHWNFMARAGPRLLAYEYNKGLVSLENNTWQPVLKQDTLEKNINIRSALALGDDSVLLISFSHGIRLLKNGRISNFTSPFLEQVRSQILYGALDIGRGEIALVTNLSGCIIIDHQGHFIQKLSTQEGLQNNNMLSVFLDRDRNLWLGLDNGIDLVLYSNAIRNIFPEENNRNTGYASVLYKNKLYLGLSSGAYVVQTDSLKDLSYTRNSFSMVRGSQGQVWGFSKVGDVLLMGHNNGAFVLEGDQTRALDAKTGFWNFDQLMIGGYKDVMLAGNYNGINFYRYQNGAYYNPRLHAHFESARFIVQHGKEIWAAHPIKGLYRVELQENLVSKVSMYIDKQHLLSPNHNKLFSIKGLMVLVTDKGIFRFDDQKQDFVPYTQLQQQLQLQMVNYMREDRYGNIWFIYDRKVGVWDGKTLRYIPELNGRINSDGFEHINVLDSNNVLIASEQGFFHLNYAAYKITQSSPSVMLRSVRALDGSDSLLYGGFSSLKEKLKLPYSQNALHFEFSANSFGQNSTLEYSYYLEGFDEDWSAWSRRTEKEYTNLPPGNYVLHAKLRHRQNQMSREEILKFSIAPPWYRTWWAYLLYALILFGLLYAFYKRQQLRYYQQQQRRLQEQRKRYEEEQQRLQMAHQLELTETERQLAELRSAKLQGEVDHKNSQLATNSMNLVHKLELLGSLRADLLNLKEQMKASGNKDVQKIIRTIDAELDHEQQWEEFEKHFDAVHTGYLRKLKEVCPELTGSELKLAAYLRLNLSTKEIAQLMNISVRGVETSRYRLRRKLGLIGEDSSLPDFLVKITSADDMS